VEKTILIIFGTTITFIANILGSTIVFFLKKEISPKFNSIVNGFSAGIMISASIWGLLIPSLEYSSHLNKLSFIPAFVGILIGSLFIVLVDFIIKKINKHKSEEHIKITRFVIAFTVHNIPEGLAVGFALGNALSVGTTSALLFAVALAVGIAIQNIPEGITVTLPVYKSTKSKPRAFFYGVLSGVVEPVSIVLGIILATQIQILLPWLLTFSAGAMLFVSVSDLLPDTKDTPNSTLGTWFFVFGFLIMMVLDLCLS